MRWGIASIKEVLKDIYVPMKIGWRYWLQITQI